jgi:hypothetical protein
MADDAVTKADLLQLKLDIQDMIKVCFEDLRSEMEDGEEQTQTARRTCESRFQRIETYIETKKAINGSRELLLKKQWDKKLPAIAFISAVVVVLFEKLISFLWR